LAKQLGAATAVVHNFEPKSWGKDGLVELWRWNLETSQKK
jgi:hypothetical protein